MAALPSEAQMREAGDRLSEKFRQLRTNGLGVEYMKVSFKMIFTFIISTCTVEDQYRSASVYYSTIEEDTSLLYDNMVREDLLISKSPFIYSLLVPCC